MPHEESAIDASRLHRHSETAWKQFAFSQLQRAGLGKTFTGTRWERRTETCHGFGEIGTRHGEESRTKLKRWFHMAQLIKSFLFRLRSQKSKSEFLKYSFSLKLSNISS